MAATDQQQRLRCGLIGCGGFGTWVTAYILEVADVLFFCDASFEAAERARDAAAAISPPSSPPAAAAAASHATRCFTDYRELVAAGSNGLLDAVFIATSNDSHCEISIAACEAGLHVFCEKAMARNTKECWQMALAAEKNSVKLLVGHKRRLRRSYARMLELMRSEELLGVSLRPASVLGLCQSSLPHH